MRIKIAYILFGISSLFKFFGKMIITKEKTIIVDVLTLPGWFIIDKCMIHQVPLLPVELVGFEWQYYPMNRDWCKMMDDLKKGKDMK